MWVSVSEWIGWKWLVGMRLMKMQVDWDWTCQERRTEEDVYLRFD